MHPRGHRALTWLLGFGIALLADRGQAQGTSQKGPTPDDTPSPVVTTARAEFSAYTDTDTVTVFTPAVSAVVTDPTRGWTANGRYLADIVSAASVDIVSTASRRWNEVRQAAGLGATYKPDTVGVNVDAGFSAEPDYVSLTAGGRLLLDLADRNVNPLIGYTYGHDTAGFRGTPFSVYSQKLDRHVLEAGVELIVDTRTSFFVGANAILERGDQKKPYRFLPLFDASVAPLIPAGADLALVTNETRKRTTELTPLSRNRFALFYRLSRRFDHGTLVVADRVYADDWGLFANTTDARYIHDIDKRFAAWLHLRAHLQSGVSFWKRAYSLQVDPDGTVTPPQYRTGDREMSPFFAATVGAGTRWNIGSAVNPSKWALTLQADLTGTDYWDVLYLHSRIAQISILQLEVQL